MTKKIFTWVAKIISVFILLQTLFFKFTGAEESIYIFSSLGVEPVGRIGSGIIELMASILIFFKTTTFYGALIALVVMIGAIASHIFVLGIEVNGDGGMLFIYACVVTICVSYLLFQNKNEFTLLKKKLFS